MSSTERLQYTMVNGFSGACADCDFLSSTCLQPLQLLMDFSY